MGDGIFEAIRLPPCLKMGDEVPKQKKNKKNSRKGLQKARNNNRKQEKQWGRIADLVPKWH